MKDLSVSGKFPAKALILSPLPLAVSCSASRAVSAEPGRLFQLCLRTAIEALSLKCFVLGQNYLTWRSHGRVYAYVHITSKYTFYARSFCRHAQELMSQPLSADTLLFLPAFVLKQFWSICHCFTQFPAKLPVAVALILYYPRALLAIK